jgi:two-component system sensor histidine kinase QseC
MAEYSLKRRLVLTLLIGIGLGWLATAAYTYFDARHEMEELLDAHLAQSASLIVAQVGGELEEIELDDDAPQLHRRARRVAFQVWERGRVLRLQSANAPAQRLSAREEGFSDATIDGRNWRVFSAWDARRRALVQVGERDDARREIAAAMAGSLLTPLAVALPLLGLLLWLLVGRGLGPLTRLGRQVGSREPDNLAALDAADAPAEVLPLVRNLNALFARVARLLEHERRFTADAAHELRTPLAALKTQAQVARGAADDASRSRALDSVIAGCDRATRLVEQLLTLARLEQVSSPRQACELSQLAREVIAELAPGALAKRVEIELAAGEAVRVDGFPELLRVLLRNLVDNAIRYSPAGTTVRVDVAPGRVAVTDEGAGVPAFERARLGERFYRVLGSGEEGSGLGLSIVRRIAELHGGALAIDDAPGGRGLRVSVRVNAAGAATRA